MISQLSKAKPYITSRIKFNMEIHIRPIDEIFRRIGINGADLSPLNALAEQFAARNELQVANDINETRKYYSHTGKNEIWLYTSVIAEVNFVHGKAEFGLSHDDLSLAARQLCVNAGSRQHIETLINLYNILCDD